MALYLDHNAGTPLRPEALEAMLPWLKRGANAGSQHRAGQAARAALEEAREAVAAALGGWPEEWVFTSGATEACNLALQGLRPRPLRYGATEHPAVVETAKALGGQAIPVDGQGRAQMGPLPEGAVVALMAANNETGVCHPVKELAPQVHAAKGLLFCDLSQAAGKMPVDVRDWDIDLAAASGPKFGGPQGSGLLWRRKGLALKPLLHGGHQEFGVRPGTENVAGAVGLAAALKAAQVGLERQAREWKRAVSTLEAGLRRLIPGLLVHGAGALRISNTLSVSVPGLDRDLLLIRLDQAGLQVSAGAACASGAHQPSPVLQAMGVPPAGVAGAVRFSFGWGQGEAQALEALRVFGRALQGFPGWNPPERAK